jgi:outer membrane receptor protein involved in Fe transport
MASATIAAQTLTPPRVAVFGIVLDQTGAPVAGAQVSLRTETSVVAQAQTGNDGSFTFEPKTERPLILVVNASGFARFEQALTAQTDAAPLRIVLVPAPLAEQITITATRTEARLDETAASVAVLSRAQLATTSSVTLDDALRQVAGFSLFRRAGSRTANPTTQGVSLRGVGASGASRALVVSDGVPLNDPFGGWVYWGRVPREAVSRVEVLRGGASELYGSDALGGVVNIITRQPAAPAATLELSYGNEQTPDASLFVGATRAGWGVRLSAEEFRTDGYVLVDERERGRVDTQAGARHATLDLTIERKLNQAARLFLRGALFGEARTNGTPVQTNRTHIRELSAGGDWASARFGSFALRAYGSNELFDQNFSAIAGDRNSEQLTRVQRAPAQVVGFNAQWSRAVGTRQTVVAGFDARAVRGASNELVFAQGRATSFADAGGRERTGGLFVEEIIRAGARLFLTGGVRADHWRNYAAMSVARPIRASSVATVNLFPVRAETALSPQASLLFKQSARLSLFASAYRAFRQPTLNELYRSFRVGNVQTLANENLRAERLTGGEAGALVNALAERLSVRGTFFWTEITRPVANVTLSVTPNLITRQRQNLGRTRACGLELETEARLNGRWTLTSGYLLADSVVTRFPANTALEGLRVPQVARHQFTFQLRYTNPARLTFGLQGRASSAQFDDDQNLLRLAPYFTIDALVSRPLKRGVIVFAAAENLFNQRYDIGRTPVLTQGPPLLVRAGLRLQFGAK